MGQLKFLDLALFRYMSRTITSVSAFKFGCVPHRLNAMHLTSRHRMHDRPLEDGARPNLTIYTFSSPDG